MGRGVPDARFGASNLIVEGDLAAGTRTSAAPTWARSRACQPVEVTGVRMGRLGEDGRPIEHWAGNEMMSLMQQLGLPPRWPGRQRAKAALR